VLFYYQVRWLMHSLASNRKRLVLAVVFIGACVVVVWRVQRSSRHQEFGRIYSAEMVESDADDSWQTRWEKNEAAVRRSLHLRQRPAPTPKGMQIGPARLGWSLGGHIYMDNPQFTPDRPNEPLWEFALSSRARLEDVTREDLRCEFYGMNDPRGTNVFGPRYQGVFTRTAWEEHAIRVADGQVFFARLVTNRSTMYAIQLGRWQYSTNANGATIGRIRAEYMVVTNPPPNKITGASAGGPRQSPVRTRWAARVSQFWH
jgi:hypothetical protein